MDCLVNSSQPLSSTAGRSRDENRERICRLLGVGSKPASTPVASIKKHHPQKVPSLCELQAVPKEHDQQLAELKKSSEERDKRLSELEQSLAETNRLVVERHHETVNQVYQPVDDPYGMFDVGYQDSLGTTAKNLLEFHALNDETKCTMKDLLQQMDDVSQWLGFPNLN